MDDLKFNLRHAEYLYSLCTERLRTRLEKIANNINKNCSCVYIMYFSQSRILNQKLNMLHLYNIEWKLMSSLQANMYDFSVVVA